MKGFLTAVIVALAGLVAALPSNAQPPPAPRPAQQVQQVIYTPDTSYQLALADLAGIPANVQPYIRYLSLYNLTPEDRAKMGQTVSFVVNSLSQRKKIQIPFFVGAGDRTVIRINLKDYGIDPKDWDKLGELGSGPKPQPEPYFHTFAEPIETKPFEKRSTKLVTKTREVTKYRDVEKTREVTKYRTEIQFRPGYGNVQVQVPYKEVEKYTDKEPYTVKEEYTEEADVVDRVNVVQDTFAKRKLVDAPWLTPQIVAQVKKLTYSEMPVYRADWFVANAILPPAYYNFFRLGTKLSDFENLVGADEKKSAKVAGQDKATVVQSTVARNNRTLTRSAALTGGYYWISHDTLKSVDDRQYAINLLDEKFDATEVIASLPNKLQVYFVTNEKLERQDFAPPDIAVDNTSVDRVVRNGRSCMICHSDGIRPIDDEVRAVTDLMRDSAKIKLLVADEKDYDRIKDLFGTNLAKQQFLDSQMYRDAVAEATGLPSEKNAQQLGAFYNQYAEHLLTPEVAAAECGMTVEDFMRVLPLSKDNVVLGLGKTPVRPVRRDQWERSYQEFMLLCIQAKQAPAVPMPVRPPANKVEKDPFGMGDPAATPLEPKTAEPAVPDRKKDDGPPVPPMPAAPRPGDDPPAAPEPKPKDGLPVAPPPRPKGDDDGPPVRPGNAFPDRQGDWRYAVASRTGGPLVGPPDLPAGPRFYAPDQSVKDRIDKAMAMKPGAAPPIREEKPPLVGPPAPEKNQAQESPSDGAQPPKGMAPGVRITITMPDPDGILMAEGQVIAGTGSKRVFTTPPLPPGQQFSYRLKATWTAAGQKRTSERDLFFKAGDREKSVDLR